MGAGEGEGFVEKLKDKVEDLVDDLDKGTSDALLQDPKLAAVEAEMRETAEVEAEGPEEGA
jgi:hypothetical protein